MQQSYDKEPYLIRRQLTESAVRASHRRARFVGLETYEAAGGTVLYGTDLGWVTIYDPTVEYVLLAKAMTFPQILAALTTAPAERFGDSARLGRIAPGFIADLTVIRADPTKDIRALSMIDYTIRDGKVVYRAPR